MIQLKDKNILSVRPCGLSETRKRKINQSGNEHCTKMKFFHKDSFSKYVSSQKQPSVFVLIKTYSENMQQIYRTAPMPKCDFNKVTKQLY